MREQLQSAERRGGRIAARAAARSARGAASASICEHEVPSARTRGTGAEKAVAPAAARGGDAGAHGGGGLRGVSRRARTRANRPPRASASAARGGARAAGVGASRDHAARLRSRAAPHEEQVRRQEERTVEFGTRCAGIATPLSADHSCRRRPLAGAAPTSSAHGRRCQRTSGRRRSRHDARRPSRRHERLKAMRVEGDAARPRRRPPPFGATTARSPRQERSARRALVAAEAARSAAGRTRRRSRASTARSTARAPRRRDSSPRASLRRRRRGAGRRGAAMARTSAATGAAWPPSAATSGTRHGVGGARGGGRAARSRRTCSRRLDLRLVRCRGAAGDGGRGLLDLLYSGRRGPIVARAPTSGHPSRTSRPPPTATLRPHRLPATTSYLASCRRPNERRRQRRLAAAGALHGDQARSSSRWSSRSTAPPRRARHDAQQRLHLPHMLDEASGRVWR